MDQGKTSSSRPWLAVGREISELLPRIDPGAFAAVVARTADPKARVFFSGQGRSGLSAAMAAMRFMHIGHKAHFCGDVTSPSVRRGDVMVIISGSGETPTSVNFGRIANSEDAHLIVITQRPHSTLAQLADTVLPVPIDFSFQLGGNLFEVTTLILLDTVAMEHAKTLPDPHGTLRYNHTNMQ